MRGPWGGPNDYDRRGYGPRGPPGPPRGYGAPAPGAFRGGPYGGPGSMGKSADVEAMQYSHLHVFDMITAEAVEPWCASKR